MFNRKTISVYHQQPFEIEVLDKGMRWAIVRYRNPQRLPKSFAPFAAYFILRAGQNFSAIGNERCPLVRVWQFKSLLSFPVKKTIELYVHRLEQTKPAQPHLPLKSPDIVKSIPVPTAVPKPHETIPALASNTMQTHAHVQLKSETLYINELNDNPSLKSFQDAL